MTVAAGSRFSPGNSPGSATVGSMTFGGRGTYLFEISDATGAPGVGLDLISIVNHLTVSASATDKFTVAVATVRPNGSAGPADHFDLNQPFQWTLAHTGTGIGGFAPERFAVDTSGFLNYFDSGSFTLGQAGSDLVLNYTPAFVPEPSAVWVIAAGAMTMRRKRRAFTPF